MSDQVRCTSCGASMTPKSDGRVHACPYCGAEVQVAIDGAQIAAGLQVDLKDVHAFLAKLAGAMEGALGERVKVHREGARVIVLEVNLDPDAFVAKVDARGAVVAQYKKLVRGVALKTATHPLDRWYDMLTHSLARHANENARVAQALTGRK